MLEGICTLLGQVIATQLLPIACTIHLFPSFFIQAEFSEATELLLVFMHLHRLTPFYIKTTLSDPPSTSPSRWTMPFLVIQHGCQTQTGNVLKLLP